jgi:hypothetical protein
MVVTYDNVNNRATSDDLSVRDECFDFSFANRNKISCPSNIIADGLFLLLCLVMLRQLDRKLFSVILA